MATSEFALSRRQVRRLIPLLGLSSHLTLNNLSHHLLLSHFLPFLLETSKRPDADVRIIQMASELHRATLPSGPSPWLGGSKFKDEAEFSKDVGPNGLYARTKLGVILFTKVSIPSDIVFARAER